MKKNEINWTVTLFLALLHIFTLIGFIALYHFNNVPAYTWILAGMMFVAGGLSITIGYHRLFSHKSFKTNRVVKTLLVLFGSSTLQGSVLDWCADHRIHHRYTDTGKDPYNIKQGFWYAHCTWLLTLDKNRHDHKNQLPDLYADSLLRWQHKHTGLIMTFMAFFFPMLIACMWGDPFGGFVIAGGLRLILNLHTTWSINSICHTFGKTHYSDQSAKDNWITALFTFGEGFHNFHHKFPIDYRNGIKWYHYDPSKWIIKLLHILNLAKDLKCINDSKILQYKINHKKKEFASYQETRSETPNPVDSILRKADEIQQYVSRLSKCESKVLQLKTVLQQAPHCKATKKRIKVYQTLIKNRIKNIKKHFIDWDKLISSMIQKNASASR